MTPTGAMTPAAGTKRGKRRPQLRDVLAGPPRILRRERDGHGVGWSVQFKRVGKRYSGWFPDHDGGRKRALKRAVAYRDAMLKKLPPATRIKRRSALNSSGAIGVCLVRYRTRAGRELERYNACWTTADGQRGGVSFSVARYGQAEAFRMAVEARRRALEERLGRYARLWFRTIPPPQHARACARSRPAPSRSARSTPTSRRIVTTYRARVAREEPAARRYPRAEQRGSANDGQRPA